jgi:RNA polymerase sigma-70 factor (ECF subfamily)
MRNKRSKDITEEELIKALKSDDGQAVGILYDRYSSFLYGLINRIVHSEQISEDILQESFVRIWKNIKSYDSRKSKLVTWMSNIARNLSIDKIRSKEYKKALLHVDPSGKNHDISDFVNIIENSSTGSFNPEHIGVKEMLDRLEPEYRKLIDMVYFEGYTQAETAKEIGIPLGTVKTRIRKAILKLREIFT